MCFLMATVFHRPSEGTRSRQSSGANIPAGEMPKIIQCLIKDISDSAKWYEEVVALEVVWTLFAE
jgi:hypothetical protein